MHDGSTLSATRGRDRLDTALAALTLAACVAVIAYKFLLVRRLNINWDEFWYLSFVHERARGELTLVLQGAYTHLFGWLPAIAGNEVDQVVAARLVMVALLGVTAWLVWLLGRRWLDGFPAALPPLVYLGFVPVSIHGGSFRADSLLAPLLVAALVLLAAPRRSSRDVLLAGALLGLAAAVTVKALLFAPIILMFLALAPARVEGRRLPSLDAAALRSVALAGLAAGVVFAATVAAHAAFLSTPVAVVPGAVPAESMPAFAVRTASTTVLDSPLFARAELFERYALWQPLPWLLIGLGLVAALHRRQYALAALALALLPIAMYRNAFPYFYVVMLAPASVLAGYSAWSIGDFVLRSASGRARGALLLAVWLGINYQCFAYLGRLSQDEQSVQRELIAGVHEIFPEPVNYVDRCGMVSSFRKVNFFMSTWGLEAYRERGVPFMPAAMRDREPAFVIVNSWAMDPAQRRADGLLAEDYELIDRLYPPYWGPLRVAGASAGLSRDDETRLSVPFAADYRVASPARVLIDDVLRQAGDVVHVPTEGVRVRPAEPQAQDGLRVTLFLAAARPPPAGGFPPLPLFTGL